MPTQLSWKSLLFARQLRCSQNNDN
jgi:hypothetical protein